MAVVSEIENLSDSISRHLLEIGYPELDAKRPTDEDFYETVYLFGYLSLSCQGWHSCLGFHFNLLRYTIGGYVHPSKQRGMCFCSFVLVICPIDT
jgi:hypothetical protein